MSSGIKEKSGSELRGLLDGLESVSRPEKEEILGAAIASGSAETRKKALSLMDPVSVDALLPELVKTLADEDDDNALMACRLLARHPLTGFFMREGPEPDRSAGVKDVYFTDDQIRRTRDAFDGLARGMDQRKRDLLMELLSMMDGLDNVTDLTRIGAGIEDESRYQALRLMRERNVYPPQVTAVLNYNCNKKCPYCFTEELLHQLPAPTTRETFMKVLDWAAAAGADRLPVTGGEPTLHGNVLEFARAVREKGMKTFFSTNALGPEAIYDELPAEAVQSITVHVLDEDEYVEGERQRAERNLKVLKDRGFEIIFRYVLARKDVEKWTTLLELADKIRPASVSFSPAFPGPGRADMSREVRSIIDMKRDVTRLIDELDALGYRAILAKPIPLCMFDREELLVYSSRAFLKNVCEIYRNGYTNNVLVNPDLTVFPCMALSLPGGDLKKLKDLRDLGKWSRSLVEPLQVKVLLPECETCQLWHMKLCQPACLSYCLTPDQLAGPAPRC